MSVRKQLCTPWVRLALLGVLLSAHPASADWPEFRGPWRNGSANEPGTAQKIGLPLTWSESNHVQWKVEIPYRGWSTPVTLEDKIWLTTATPDGHDFFVICANAGSGKVLLNKKLFHSDNPEPLGNNVNTYASPSATVEPGRVYVHFGSYGTACLDSTNGEVLWSRSDLPCRHFRGPGSSVVLFENLLILTMDGYDFQYTTALDKQTGRTVWKTDRSTKWDEVPLNGDMHKGFSTPIFAEVDGQWQMFSPASKEAYAYDPRTGRELWKIRHGSHTSSGRAVYGNGLVFLPTGNGDPQIWAVRPDGHGDVSSTHVAWKYSRNVPRMPSPLLVGELLFLVCDDGAVTCLEAKTGAEVWRERLKGHYTASPIYGDGRVYIFNEQGLATVLEAGRTFNALASNTLNSGLMASPAVLGKALILRTKTHLYRIE